VFSHFRAKPLHYQTRRSTASIDRHQNTMTPMMFPIGNSRGQAFTIANFRSKISLIILYVLYDSACSGLETRTTGVAGTKRAAENTSRRRRTSWMTTVCTRTVRARASRSTHRSGTCRRRGNEARDDRQGDHGSESDLLDNVAA